MSITLNFMILYNKHLYFSIKKELLNVVKLFNNLYTDVNETFTKSYFFLFNVHSCLKLAFKQLSYTLLMKGSYLKALHML